jgi:hypothetical protein
LAGASTSTSTLTSNDPALEREELKKELAMLQDRMEALEEGDWDEESYTDDDELYSGEVEEGGVDPSPAPQKVDSSAAGFPGGSERTVPL